MFQLAMILRKRSREDNGMGGSRLKRDSQRKNQSPRFLIVSEGAVTERQYLEAIRQSRRIRTAQIVYQPPPPTSPMEIVQKAVSMRKEAAKRDPFDEVWCIFDVEARVSQKSSPRLQEAINVALKEDVLVALSNPCFELWILLHSQDREAWTASEKIQEECYSCGLVRDKKIINVEMLLRNYSVARNRAVKLEHKHDREQKVGAAARNPASTVYKLVDKIYERFPATAI